MNAPAAVGLNVNTTVQLAPAASGPFAQVPDLLKWVGAAGYVRLDEAVPPVFEIVMVCGVDDVPTVWLPKAADVGLAETAAGDPAGHGLLPPA